MHMQQSCRLGAGICRAPTVGDVSRDITYTLSASNACGGIATQTATLHVAGSIDPPPPGTLASVFYPTDFPQRRDPKFGSVPSQRQTIAEMATTFTNNEQYDHQNKLVVVGHADVRGPEKYNLALSQMRAELVKNYLISQGIGADKVETRAEGKTNQLDKHQIETLQSQNSQKPQTWMVSRKKATWLAYNRRVDIILEPSGQQSAQTYPNDAPDAHVLWQRTTPTLKTIETEEHIQSDPQDSAAASNQ